MEAWQMIPLPVYSPSRESRAAPSPPCIAPFPPGIHPDVPLAVINTVISTVLAGPALQSSFFIPLTVPWLLAGAVFHLVSTTKMFYREKEPPGEPGMREGKSSLGGMMVHRDFHTWMWKQAHGEVINQGQEWGTSFSFKQRHPRVVISAAEPADGFFQGDLRAVPQGQTLSRCAAPAGRRILESPLE